MAQDVGWCRSVVVSFPSSLVGFLGFHPYMRLFSFRKLFVTLHIVINTPGVVPMQVLFFE